jgi:GH15 family glucan-1,4-alpha-glucosidase
MGAAARTPVSAKIEDYALLGDCTAAALVSRAGSIDWLCWPRFDSDACCAALLGGPEHGRWLLAPQDQTARIERSYRPDTLVLDTQFTTASGIVRVTDFMALHRKGSHVIRIVTGVRGCVALRSELILRFDYGSLVPWVTRLPHAATSFVAGPHRVILRSSVPQRGEDLKTVGEFEMRARQSAWFVLSYSLSYKSPPRPIRATSALERTQQLWRRWIRSGAIKGQYAAAVRRSCITLKALTDHATGGIIAAPTTSLPERIGGTRNWDYRYCWVRDATFTLQAMMNAGFYREARRWRAWLLRAAAGDPPQMQIMYRIAGERLLPEWQLDYLPGYEGSQPVRVGNAASGQVQLDVYGELMDAMYQGRLGRLAGSEADWQLQRALLEHLERIWMEPDRGIWEVRGPARHFTHSKVMAWTAVDRMIKSAERFGLEAPLSRWRSFRSRIHDDVCRRGFNRRLGYFVQSYGSRTLDASLLLLPLVGFLPIEDQRVRATVAAIERNLTTGGLVRRYSSVRSGDGLPPGEGVFLACSFWLADVLVLLGRRREAHRLFRRLLGLRNDVGLLSEEYDPRLRRLVGNFPQSFSHIALVNTAFNLNQHRGPARQRAGSHGRRAAPPGGAG